MGGTYKHQWYLQIYNSGHLWLDILPICMVKDSTNSYRLTQNHHNEREVEKYLRNDKWLQVLRALEDVITAINNRLT